MPGCKFVVCNGYWDVSTIQYMECSRYSTIIVWYIMDAGYERAVYYESPWVEGVVSQGRKVLLSPLQSSLNILPELFLLLI
jgi:hypothetical protein